MGALQDRPASVLFAQAAPAARSIC
jgi:hypothetical protein